MAECRQYVSSDKGLLAFLLLTDLLCTLIGFNNFFYQGHGNSCGITGNIGGPVWWRTEKVYMVPAAAGWGPGWLPSNPNPFGGIGMVFCGIQHQSAGSASIGFWRLWVWTFMGWACSSTNAWSDKQSGDPINVLFCFFCLFLLSFLCSWAVFVAWMSVFSLHQV